MVANHTMENHMIENHMKENHTIERTNEKKDRGAPHPACKRWVEEKGYNVIG